MSIIPILSWVLAASVRASLLVLVVLLLQRLLRSRLSAKWKYALWTPVLSAILIPAQPLLPYWEWPIANESHTTSRVANLAAVQPVDEVVASEVDIASLTPANPAARAPAGGDAEIAFRDVGETELSRSVASSQQTWDWWTILAAGWLLGAVCLGVVVWVSYTSTMRRVRRRAISVDQVDLARVRSLAREIGLRGPPQVWRSPEVKAPAVCGVLRPMLLLNESFFQMLSREEADFVLRHELMHIRRGDILLNTMLFGLLSLHWFNPLLWYAFFRAGADREAACDEDVLHAESPARRVAYGKTLLRMEADLPQSGLCLGFVGMVQKGKRIRERIYFVANPKRMGMPARSLALFCMCVIMILGIAKSAETQSKPQTQQLPSAKEAPNGKEQQTNAKTPQPKPSNVGCRLLRDKDGKVRTVEVIRNDDVMRLLESGKANKEEFSSIQELRRLRDLRRLKVVYGSHLSADDVIAISKLPHIVELEIGFPGIASEYVTIEGDTSPLGQLKTLEVVRLCKDGIHDEDLRFIAQLPRLHTLEFRADNGRNEEVHCTDKCAAYLCQAKQLRHLTIQGENFSEQFFGSLARGQLNLKSLELDSGRFTGEPPRPIATQEAVAKLQGKWRVISLKIGAKEASERSIRDMRMLIQDDTISVNGAVDELRWFRIDATTNPKKIDLPTEKEIYGAIYELDGDRLRLCWQQSQDLERPTSFDTEGATIVSIMLERMKP